MDNFFHDDPRTIRYGVNENIYGFAEIAAFAARIPDAHGRKLSRTVITTYGSDFAVASTLYERSSAHGRVRQTNANLGPPGG